MTTSRFEDCTIVSVDPLTVRRDADTAVAIPADTMVATTALSIDDRVRVEFVEGRAIIVGRAGGTEVADLSAITDAITELQDGYRPRSIVKFTASGTFTPSDYPWLRAVRVRVQGGGGAGGGCSGSGTGFSIGQGGGGGGYAESFIDDIEGLGASVAVTVGAGGTGVSGSTGAQGGTSSFGSLVAATGGFGGQVKPKNVYGPYVAPGQGGGGYAGDIRVWGQGGLSGAGSDTLGIAGTGGSSHMGGGAAPNGSVSGGASLAGVSAYNYGGGGSGAYSTGGGGAQAGGNGGPGIVIVELYA